MNKITQTAIRVGLAPGAVIQRLFDNRDLRRFPPPGRMIPSRGRQVHVLEMGMDQPGYPIIFESSEAGFCLDWYKVQTEISQFAPVVTYDRPGFGWSDPPKHPKSGLELVTELKEVLATAGIEPPYILVGHSFGGMLVRLFAAHNSSLVAGYVVLDGLHINNIDMEIDLSGGRSRLSDEDLSTLDMLRVAGKAGMLRMLFNRGLPIYKRKLDPEILPQYRSRFVSSNAVEGLISQVKALPQTLSQVSAQASEPPEEMPSIIVRSEYSLDDDPSTEMEQTLFFGRMQTIQWDRPDTVVKAVREIIKKVNEKEEQQPVDDNV